MSEGVSCFKNLYVGIVRMQHASSQGTVRGGNLHVHLTLCIIGNPTEICMQKVKCI